MCDILPTIPECENEENEKPDLAQGAEQDDRSAIASNVAADPMYHNFEQLVGSMLEEREKLTTRIRDSEDKVAQLRAAMQSSERRSDILSRQIDQSFSKEASAFIREIARLKEQLSDRNEEVEDLKCERRNTQILLEHLEVLVSRHEKSLRLTVAKRHVQQPPQMVSDRQGNFGSAVSSEIEILEVLRSLFAHHKALDEKIRSKLKDCQSRCFDLEDQIDQLTRRQRTHSDPVSHEGMMSVNETKDAIQLMSTYVQTDFESNDLVHNEKVRILREECDRLVCINKDTSNRCNQLEGRLANADERNLDLQRQSNHSQDVIGKLESSLSSKEILLKQTEEKYSLLKESYDVITQRIQHSSQTDIVSPLQKCPSEEHLQNILLELEELQAELSTCKQREALKEEHNARLTATVEKLLAESEQKTNAHLQDRLQILQDKNRLISECEKMRRRIDECNLHKFPDDVIEECMTQSNGNVVKNVRQAFGITSEPSLDSLRANISIGDLLEDTDCKKQRSPSKIPFDLQDENREVETLAAKLQYQLDIINDEMRRIERAKSEADRRFDHLERQAPLHTAADGFVSLSPTDSLLRRSNPILSNSDFRFGYNSPPSPPFVSPAQSSQSLLNLRQNAKSRASHEYNRQDSVKQPHRTQGSREDDVPINRNAMDEQPEDMASGYDEPDRYGSFKKSHKSYNNLRGSIGKFLRLYSTSPAGNKPLLAMDGPPKQPSTREEEALESELAQTDRGCLTAPPLSMEFQKRITRKQELLDRLLHSRVPFPDWDTAAVVAWLELWVGMPAWYVAACRANVKSGAIMASLSDGEIQREIGISNPLHRLKLRLAIGEIVDYTTGPTSERSPTYYLKTISAFREMNHEWVGNHWLATLGLKQYRSNFMGNLVDARMLPYLTKKDFRSILKLIDSGHRTSLNCGIGLLRRINFNLIELNERRKKCADFNRDIIVWTNDRIREWLHTIGLSDWLHHLPESGLHGALFVLDSSFDARELASRLQVPSSNTQVRQVLQIQFDRLLKSCSLDCRGSPQQPMTNSALSSCGNVLDGR